MGDILQRLPRRFHEDHEFAFYLHDILVEMIKEGERNNVFSSEVSDEENTDLSDLENLSGEELLERLEGEHDEVIDDLFFKQVFVAVLSDFCQFIHHALRASEKGWLTVSYALLRKPFQENLLVLEWLLSEPEDFLEVFREREIKDYAPSGRIDGDRKKEIAKGALNQISFPFPSAEEVYNFRYEYGGDYGLTGLSNKAMHIVTTHPEISTEKENLNFVFSDYEDKEE